MSRTNEAGAERNNRVGDVWLAEIGDHGASAICTSKDDAFRTINEWRQFRAMCGGASVDYVHWVIWKNGKFVVGHWPDKSCAF